jgi:predicted nuclease of predicted toxin-antitoxin system
MNRSPKRLIELLSDHRLSVLRGAPPKVIWIRLGNCTTNDVAQLIRRHHEAIAAFAKHEEATFLALG